MLAFASAATDGFAVGLLYDMTAPRISAIQQFARLPNHKAFAGTVTFVKTSHFARPKEDSPNVGHGHHWFGNAESYFLVGDALGRAMLQLHQKR